MVGIIIDLGGGPNHQRLGFRYWKNPGALNARSDLVNNVGLGRFLAIVSVLVQAAFSFQGMELVAVYVSTCITNYFLVAEPSFSAASETESPRRNISKAVRRVFYRILIFYVSSNLFAIIRIYFDELFVRCSALWSPVCDKSMELLRERNRLAMVIGMLVPFNDPNLLQDTGNAAQSPYVIAMTRAGIHTP